MVLYDPSLTATLPIGMTVQSLMNALAHADQRAVDGLAGGRRPRSGAGCRRGARAGDRGSAAGAHDLAAREAATLAAIGGRGRRGSGQGRRPARRPRTHLGGALGLEHAALHSVLLPQFIAHLRESEPRGSWDSRALVGELERAIGCDHLEPHPARSAGRGPACRRRWTDWAWTRPRPASLAGGPSRSAGAHALATPSTGCVPPAARIELGRAATGHAGGAPRWRERGGRCWPCTAGAPRQAALCAATRDRRARSRHRDHRPAQRDGNRWYGVRYGEPGAGADAEVAAALARVDAALDGADPFRRPRRDHPGRLLAGCLPGPGVRRPPRRRALAAVLAPCGARIGPPAEWAPTRGRPAGWTGCRCCWAPAASDPWVARDRIEATAAWFRAAGRRRRGHRPPRRTPRHLRPAADAGARADPGVWRPRREPAASATPSSPRPFPARCPATRTIPAFRPWACTPSSSTASGFTSPRAENRRTWCYRIRPASQRRAFVPLPHPRFGAGFAGRPPEINLSGWAPPAAADEPRDFLDGLVHRGRRRRSRPAPRLRLHLYCANRDMDRRAFYDADGDLVLIPAAGRADAADRARSAGGRARADRAPAARAGLLGVAGRAARAWLRRRGVRSPLPPARARSGGRQRPGRRPPLPGPGRLVRRSPGSRASAWWPSSGAQLHRGQPGPLAVRRGRLARATTCPSSTTWPTSRRWAASASITPIPRSTRCSRRRWTKRAPTRLDLIVFAPRWDVSRGTFRPPYFHRNPVSESERHHPRIRRPRQPLSARLLLHHPLADRPWSQRPRSRARARADRRRGRSTARPANRPVVPVRDRAAAVADPLGRGQPAQNVGSHLGQPPFLLPPRRLAGNANINAKSRRGR